MKWVWIILTGLLLLLITFIQSSEHFTEAEYAEVKKPCACPVSSPCSDANCKAWDSMVTAMAPTGAVNADYITVLAAFYDQVYSPAPMKPTEAQVDTFLASPAGTVAGVDIPSVKRMILDGFHIDSSMTASQREAKSQMFQPSDVNLAPKMGRDEVRTRTEEGYTGANPNPSSKFSEGNYAAVTQTEPLNPGHWEDGTALWKGPRPASVCPCAENIM